MKRNYSTLLFLLFFTKIAISQSLEFPMNNAVWKEMHTSIAGPFPAFRAVCGDTTINNIQYSQVRELQVDSDLQVTGSNYLGGLRQQGPRIFFRYASEAEEFLLYDFSLEQGDEIELQLSFNLPNVTLTVESVDTQAIEGKLRRVIHFKNNPPDCSFGPEMWIEGIGSTYGLLDRGLSPCLASDLGSQLLCFQYLDEYLNLTLIECFLPEATDCGIINSINDDVRHGNGVVVYPNPASSQVSINWKGGKYQTWRANLYSVLGQKLATASAESTPELMIDISGLPNGTYFIEIENENGMKTGNSSFVKN